MEGNYSPQTTLLLVLGASAFPQAGVESSIAFTRAADSLASYFDVGFRLPKKNLFWFFNSPFDPSRLDEQISKELTSRIQELQAGGTPVTDLIVYYVGHGSFDEERRYYLALKSTRKENQSVSGLRVEALMRTLSKLQRDLRKYVILDACFAAEAVYRTQSNIETAVGQSLRVLPVRGTAFLCSSSRDVMSEFLPDASNTKFTKALTEILWDGNADFSSNISLKDLQTLLERKFAESPDDFPHPEIHTPDQPEGDPAKCAIFPEWAPARGTRSK